MNQLATYQRGDAAALDRAADAAALQFVSFLIGDEEYGLDIMAVREIRAWSGATRLPNAPQHLRGVVNLRGLIVPVFDLRARFGAGLTDATKTHVVIILATGDRIVGLLVDAVSDILTVGGGEIRPVPPIDRTVDAGFLTGLVNMDERMVALLDADSLFAAGEIPAQNQLAQTNAASGDA
ncbi:MAG: chemotaxis protein CheW [Pseudomonadota bacterium]